MTEPEREPLRIGVLHCLDCPALQIDDIVERCGLMRLGPRYDACKALATSAWCREPPPGWCPLRKRPALFMLADGVDSAQRVGGSVRSMAKKGGGVTSRTTAARAARERRRQEREAAAVDLAPGWRLRPLDERNWIVEQQRGKSWTCRGYYPSVPQACRAAARILLDRECRASLQRSVAVVELGEKIMAAEDRLQALYLRAVMRNVEDGA